MRRFPISISLSISRHFITLPREISIPWLDSVLERRLKETFLANNRVHQQSSISDGIDPSFEQIRRENFSSFFFSIFPVRRTQFPRYFGEKCEWLNKFYHIWIYIVNYTSVKKLISDFNEGSYWLSQRGKKELVEVLGDFEISFFFFFFSILFFFLNNNSRER